MKTTQVHSKFNIAVLPPTSAAAEQHSLRTYFQVQTWMDNDLNPLDWGWEKKNGQYMPIMTTQNPAPDELMRLIACNCTKNQCHTLRCECKRSGLKCTVMCGRCQGDSCSNSSEINIDIEDECCD